METFTPVIQSTFIEPVRASTLNTNLFKNVIPPPAKDEKLASYLRIRPVEGLVDSPFTVKGQYLHAKPPKTSKAYKALKDGETGERRYHFSHIFTEDATQEEFYLGTAERLVQRSLKGESSLCKYINNTFKMMILMMILVYSVCLWHHQQWQIFHYAWSS